MFDEPNLVIPLAASYNERGLGYTNAITNGIDQRKVNSVYDLVKNSITGKSTLYLCKRNGFVDSGSTFGTSGQVAYQVHRAPTLAPNLASALWVFSTSGNDVRASNASGTTTTIVTAANEVPVYVDMTSISGAETLLLQTRNTVTQVIRNWFSTAIGTFTEITDADAPASVGKAVMMDGYMFLLASPTNRIHNSDLNSLSAWTASSYITKQIQQDVSLAMMRFGKQIIVLGYETMEVFVNAGNPTGSPLKTVSELSKKIGTSFGPLGSRGDYYTELDGKLYFIGASGGQIGRQGLWVYNGSQADKISPNSVDKIINEQGLRSIGTMTILGKRAIYIQLSAQTDATQIWLMYFPEWNDWFEWNSTAITPVNTYGSHIGVGSNQHKLYQASPSSYQDDGTDYTWTHQFQLPGKGNGFKRMPYMSLKGDTARSAQNISVQFSDDDYQTFSTSTRTIDMTSQQKMLTRCGSWHGDRVVRLSHTGNTEVRLSQFLARID